MEVFILFYFALCDNIAKGNKQLIILYDNGVGGGTMERFDVVSVAGKVLK